MTEFTIHDVFAGVMAVVLIMGVFVLLATGHSVPEAVYTLLGLAGGFFFRGGLNGVPQGIKDALHVPNGKGGPPA